MLSGDSSTPSSGMQYYNVIKHTENSVGGTYLASIVAFLDQCDPQVIVLSLELVPQVIRVLLTIGATSLHVASLCDLQ